MSNIVVFGSVNTDMTIRAERIPAPGETVLGGDFLVNPGGKGANQAVAAARACGRVCLIGRVGDDFFGREALRNLTEAGVDTAHLKTDSDKPSGAALILIDAKGENCIAVASGANAALSAGDADDARNVIESADTLLLQLESPLEAVVYAASIAHAKGVRVVLNPAPAQKLPPNLLAMLDYITPNETEAQLLTGIAVTDDASAQAAARALQVAGVKNVIITLGSRGALLAVGTDKPVFIPAYKVEAVDTTAAGDVFNGAFVVALAEGQTPEAAVRFGAAAAAISVTRRGAQASAPCRTEIDKFGGF